MPDYIEEYLRQIMDNRDVNRWDALCPHLDVKEPILMSVRLQDERGGRGELDVKDVVAQEMHLIISGASGMGKTTTLKWLTLVYAKKCLEGAERLIPLYVDLGLFRQGRFYDHAFMIAHKNGLEKEDFKELLDDGKLAIFLDGLDLLGGAGGFEPAIEIRKFMSGFSHCKFVLSSRSGFFEGFESSCEVYELVELDDSKIKGYIHKYLGEGDKANTLTSRIFDRQNEQLKSLCRNPMMLCLVIRLQENDKIADDRAGMYRESIEGIITHYKKKSKTLSSDGQLVRDVLEKMAFSMQMENLVRLDYGKALDVASSRISPERYGNKISAKEVLDDCFGLGLLHKDGGEVRFGFHQSFQEYFAAVKLKEIFEYGYDISESFSQPKWKDTLVFLSEITERPDELVDDVLDADKVFLAAKLTVYVDDRRVESLCARLLDKIDSEYDLERTMAVGSFAYIGEGAVDALIELFGDGEVAPIAVKALVGIGDERSLELLMNALPDDDPEVQLWTAIAREGVEDGCAATPLMDALHGNNLHVRRETSHLLERMEDRRALELYARELDYNPEMRATAEEVFGELEDEEYIERLILILRTASQEPAVRHYFVVELKSLCGPMHREKLEPLLKSENRDVASAAFEILHSIKLKEQEKIKIFKELKYLLRWDDIPENDSDRLLKYLQEDYDIAWAERAKIRKSDGKTLIISKDKNSAEIKIDDSWKKATLKPIFVTINKKRYPWTTPIFKSVLHPLDPD